MARLQDGRMDRCTGSKLLPSFLGQEGVLTAYTQSGREVASMVGLPRHALLDQGGPPSTARGLRSRGEDRPCT